jgi:hypothetical protein
MKTGRKITLELSDEVFAELADFKKRANISDTKTAIFALIKYALTLPPYFKSFDWELAEKEADDEIASGNVKEFTSLDAFLADLKA